VRTEVRQTGEAGEEQQEETRREEGWTGKVGEEGYQDRAERWSGPNTSREDLTRQVGQDGRKGQAGEE
jgi:hypothetical protein